jgi:hypothetical protein
VIDGRVSSVVELRLSEGFAVEERAQREVRRLALIETAVVDERVHAEDVLLSVLPAIALSPGLGDGPGELEGEIALGPARSPSEGAQDGALGSLGASEDPGVLVVDAFGEGDLASAPVRVGEDGVLDLARIDAQSVRRHEEVRLSKEVHVFHVRAVALELGGLEGASERERGERHRANARRHPAGVELGENVRPEKPAQVVVEPGLDRRGDRMPALAEPVKGERSVGAEIGTGVIVLGHPVDHPPVRRLMVRGEGEGRIGKVSCRARSFGRSREARRSARP